MTKILYAYVGKVKDLQKYLDEKIKEEQSSK